MDNYTRNFIVAGGRGGNPSSISVKMEPVKLNESMGVAIKSIAYGELYNITPRNNSFKIKKPKTLNVTLITNNETEVSNYSIADVIQYGVVNYSNDFKPVNDDEVTLFIPTGRYETNESVLSEISKVINTFLADNDISKKCRSTNGYGLFTIYVPKDISIVEPETDSLMASLGVNWLSNELSVFSGSIQFRDTVEMCFIYLNIVQNSFINGRRSRLLCVCPIVKRSGYTFFEFQNLSYVPIEVREFSDLSLTIRDMRGQLLQLDNKFDTIVTLHMKNTAK